MRKLLLMFIGGAAIMLVTQSFNPTGAPGNYSGSPSASGKCNNSGCHTGTQTWGGSLNLGILEKGTTTVPTEYEEGKTYTVGVVILTTSTAKKSGFCASVVNSSNAVTGTMSAAGAGVKFVSSSYATHSTPKTCDMTQPLASSYSFDWTPTAGSTGTVSFYAAGIVADGTGGSNLDETVWANKSLTKKATASIKNATLNKIKVITGSGKIELTETASDLAIFNTNGKLVLAAKNTQSVNISNLSAGTYFVKALIAGQKVTSKFVLN